MLHAGIVDEDVDGAEFVDAFLHQAFDLVRLRQVGAIIADADLVRVLDAPTGLLDLGGVAETVQHHVGALGGEGGRHREADAGSRAGDEGGLAFEEHAGPFYFARSKAAVLPSMMLRVDRKSTRLKSSH